MTFPFFDLGDGTPRPYLPIKIINPYNDKHVITFGLIDTGADECALPAGLSVLLNHKLQEGEQNEIQTGNGITLAYRHTTKIEILDISGSPIYTMNKTLIDFMPNLHVVLLGTRSFLSNFILKINYPNKEFSLG